MEKNILNDRRRALEESFFAKHNAELQKKLQEKRSFEHRKEHFEQLTGIHNDKILEELAGLDMGDDTLVALSLVPLVQVAWADGTMEDKERKAILKSAHEAGVAEGSDNHVLLDTWLVNKPEAALFGVWKDYVGALVKVLDETSKNELKEKVLERAFKVADAAGGILGLYNRVSKVEQEVLDQLKSAFD
jgi:uncharacterized tellurite resistance protein B-like protein